MSEADKLGIFQDIIGKLKDLVSGGETEDKEAGLEKRANMVRRAFHEQFHQPQPVETEQAYIKDIFEDKVIAKMPGGVLWAYPYEMTDDGITFGEPVKVEVVFEEVKAVSLDEQTRRVRDSWYVQFGDQPPVDAEEKRAWVKEIFDDRVIVEMSSGLVAYPYKITDRGDTVFGEPFEVEATYLTVKEGETVIYKAVMRTEGGKKFSSSAYLYVPDPEKPSTWKLRIQEEPGEVTVAQLGRAAAALGPGFRGQRVELPGDAREAASKKLIGLYRSEGVEDADIPSYLWGLADMKAPKEKGMGVFIPVVKGLDGKDWWVSFSSSAFLDREDEIISRKAMDFGVAYGDETGERGELRLFHLPGSRVGLCEFQMREGCFLIEAGTWDETDVAVAAKETLSETPDEWGTSVGFAFNPTFFHKSIYEDEVVFQERSVVRAERAANPFTAIEVIKKEVERMGTKEDLEKLIGPEMAAKYLAEAAAKTIELADNVVFKEKDDGRPPDGETPDETAPAATVDSSAEKKADEKVLGEKLLAIIDGLAKGDLKALRTKLDAMIEDEGGEKEAAPEGAKAPSVIEITEDVVKAIAAEVMQSMGVEERMGALDEKLTALAESVKQQTASVEAVKSLVKADVDAEVQRRVEDLPAARFVLAEKDKLYRPTEQGEVTETVIPSKSPFHTVPGYEQLQSQH